MTVTEPQRKLADYLDLIEQERECRPAEAMLADEIVRLRQVVAKGVKLLRATYGSKEAFAYRANDWVQEAAREL